MNMVRRFFFFFFFCLMAYAANPAYTKELNTLQRFIGNQDALLVADPQGNILFSKNSDKKLIPASTLKLLTSLVGLHYLGTDYRFVTEFYTDDHGNLKIKGYGDPLLVSEVVENIVKMLSTKIGAYNHLILDNSYFAPVVIPGVTSSLNPYDAPNGALCVNFNTISFRYRNGRYVSAEPQTPLLPFALKKIKSLRQKNGRVIFSQERDEITLYAGHMFHYFLEKQGVRSKGNISIGRVQKDKDTLIHTHVSTFSIEDVISKLLEYSNNFIANQVFIAAGAKAYGQPGTLEKGVRAAAVYVRDVLKTDDIRIAEGSGISRENRISAKNMYKILEKFEAYHFLMRRDGKEIYKTGTLRGIRTRAGYIKNGNGGLYRFVVMVNTPGKSAKRISDRVINCLGN